MTSPASISRPTSTHRPTWCTQLELAAPQPDRLQARPGYPRARVLVRLHGDPLGYVHTPLEDGAVPTETVLDLVRQELAGPLARHLAAEGLDVPEVLGTPLPQREECPTAPDISRDVTVVVCTRNRAETLRGCLGHLAALTYPRLEVVVVDNAPSDGSTWAVIEELVGSDPRFRYVLEPAPGLSWARNRGLAEARGSVLAYTDDDVSVDPSWIEGVVRGFARREDVTCVTGLVCTASLDTAQEAFFDARVTWASNCVRRLYDLAGSPGDDALYPYSPGIFGTGANFAFDTAALRALGGFDEALGAGALTKGGEDLDAFVRVLLAGGALVYEPSSIVWHHHRADAEGMRSQMFAYGTGLTAFLAKHLADRRTRYEVLRRIPLGVRKLARVKRTTEAALGDTGPVDSSALVHELAGFASGPVLYARARWSLRRAAPSR